jgi:hypothetical protein
MGENDRGDSKFINMGEKNIWPEINAGTKILVNKV